MKTSDLNQISRRRFISLTGTGVSALALWPLLEACGIGGGPVAQVKELKPPASKVSLEFWNPFTGPDGNFMKSLVGQFNGETPNVQVAVTTLPDYYTKVRAAAVGNQLPHVAIMHLDQIPLQASDKVITPIDDLIKLLGLQASDFTEKVWNGTHWKGKQYSVPLDVHTESFYWNKELFRKAGLDPEKPPTDKASFMDAAKAITSKAGVPGFMVVSTGPGVGFLAGNVWASLFYQGGGEWTNAGYSQATFNSDAGVQAASFMKSLIDQGISPKNVESDSEIAAFKQGKNGMVFSGIWETTGYGGVLKDSLGAGPVPKIFGAGVWSGSHTLTVPNRKTMSADERQGAYYFINWVSKHSIEWAKAGQIPARKSVRESAEFQSIPYISAIAKQADDARFFPPIPAAADMEFGPGGVGEALGSILTGKKDAKAALDEAAAHYTQVLQENKQKYGF